MNSFNEEDMEEFFNNGNNKNKHRLFIEGIGKIGNKIVNEAIDMCVTSECNKVSSVHIFIATVEYMKDRDNVLEKIGTSFIKMNTAYEFKVGQGDYGSFKGLKPLDSYLSEYLIKMMMTLQSKRQATSTADMLEYLRMHLDDDLIKYIEYIGVSIESLLAHSKDVFEIPEYLEQFINDANLDIDNKDDKIFEISDYVDTMINVLCRKTKKSPCLVGDAGVGKTSIVEALVKRINYGNVPKRLKDAKVLTVNSSALIGGTMYRGEFEKRLDILFKFAKKSKAILFLDEIHTFMNLGKNGDDSSQSVGNVIKQYLNDGTVSIIGTTTPTEWHRFIEGDAALSRRLQDINVGEPTVEESIDILNNAVINYEKYHSLNVSYEAVVGAVKLSDRYIKSKKLPDKAFTILDDACANVEIRSDKEHNTVELSDIEHVISKITGIDVKKLSESDLVQLKNLDKAIHANMVGQDKAVDTVVRAIKRGKVGINDENRPISSFLFLGPTGVGKTLLCKLVSKEIFGKKESFIRVDMSEYLEGISASKLIGTAPGYIGYGKGGNLTEKVKKNPNSLILFDEIEKADKKVFDVFLQLLDEGTLTDESGQVVDFKNCIIVMTSNAGYGADELNKKQLGFGLTDIKVDIDRKEEIVKKELESTFRPEFINRIDNIVIFDSITKEQAKDIAKLELDKVTNRMLNKNINMHFDANVVGLVAEKGFSKKYGARNIIRVIQSTIMDVITDEIIEGKVEEHGVYCMVVKNNELKICSIANCKLEKKKETIKI